MTNGSHDPVVVQAVRDAVDEVVGVEVGDDELDVELGETGIDSLDLIEIVMVVEEALDISTKEEDFEGVTTLRMAIQAFERKTTGVA